MIGSEAYPHPPPLRGVAPPRGYLPPVPAVSRPVRARKLAATARPTTSLVSDAERSSRRNGVTILAACGVSPIAEHIPAPSYSANLTTSHAQLPRVVMPDAGHRSRQRP